MIVTVLPKNVFIVMQIESVIFVFILNSSFLSSSFFHFKFYDQLFPYTIRPANVPEGAHVQWEIELLGFEMPKVIYKYPTFVKYMRYLLLLVFYLFYIYIYIKSQNIVFVPKLYMSFIFGP